MKSLLGLLALLILLLVGLGIGLSNTTPVTLSFFRFETIELPFFVWLMAAVAIGALITAFLGWFRQAALRRENKRLNKALNKR